MTAKILEDEIRRKLYYCPDYGDLIWQVSGHGIRKGEVAGNVNGQGYLQVMVNGVQLLAHRVAFFLMEDYWPEEIDHIDRNKQNNCWKNLRECTRSENQKNKNPFVNNKVYNKIGIKGVSLRPSGRYQVLGRGPVCLGTFDTLEEAKIVSDNHWKGLEI